MKLGDQGALWCEGGRPPIHVPAFTVKVVDSTAAGDAFTAALAVAWSEGRSPQEILRFACAAGGLAVTRAGAQPSLPTRAEVEQLLAAH
jgi:ribokinase